MLYAKVKDSAVLVFPYSEVNLKSENPNSNYDNRFTLAEWYAQTEDAQSNMSCLVEVLEQSAPTINLLTQNLQQHTLPTLVDSNWVLSWTVTNKSEEEILAVQAAQPNAAAVFDLA